MRGRVLAGLAFCLVGTWCQSVGRSVLPQVSIYTGKVYPSYGFPVLWLVSLLFCSVGIWVVTTREPEYVVDWGQFIASLSMIVWGLVVVLWSSLATFPADPECMYPFCWPLGFQDVVSLAPLVSASLVMAVMSVSVIDWRWRVLLPIGVLAVAMLVQQLLWEPVWLTLFAGAA